MLFRSAYVDPRMVDEGEVKAAYELLGLKKPTADDIKKFVGQYSESELAGKAEAYLPTARYNSIIEQLDALAGGAGSTASKEVLDAIDTVKRDFNSQLADLGVDISKVSSEVGATKDALLTAIGDAQKGNTSRFGDIDKAIADLKAAGLTEAQVQKIVDDSSAGVSKDFKAALDAAVKGNSEELTKIKDDLTTKIGDVQTAIETKLGDQATAFNAKVQDLMDQGKTYQEATELALKDIGLKITDLGTDFATKLKDTSDALGKQIGDLSTKLSDVETNLLTKIADNEKAGLSRDEATQKAVTDLATEFGVAKEDLLKQIGATETTLNERVNTLQKTFTEQVGTLETNILTKMAEYEKAGVSRDEALSKAIGDVATNLGTTKESLLKQIGATEASLKEQVTNVETSLGTKITESQDAILKELGLVKTGLSEEIEGAKESLSTQIGDVETNILNRMADYEKAGISRDEALGRAVDDVATQLGTTRDDILTRIGETETTLKGDISTAKQEVLDRAIGLPDRGAEIHHAIAGAADPVAAPPAGTAPRRSTTALRRLTVPRSARGVVIMLQTEGVASTESADATSPGIVTLRPVRRACERPASTEVTSIVMPGCPATARRNAQVWKPEENTSAVAPPRPARRRTKRITRTLRVLDFMGGTWGRRPKNPRDVPASQTAETGTGQISGGPAGASPGNG